MDMRSSFDSRDDGHAYVGYGFQNLTAFVVNLAPNAGVGNIAKRVTINPNNEVAICTRQYDDLVCSILRNPVKGIHDLRMVLCRESAWPCCEIRQPARPWHLASSSWCDRHRSSHLDGFA